MKYLVPTIAKWGARAHLVGVGVVLGYGLNQGDLTAAYDHAAVAAVFNPLVVGAAIGLAGWAKIFVAAPASTDNTPGNNEGKNIDDGNSDFLDDDMATDCEFESDDMDYVTYDHYGAY